MENYRSASTVVNDQFTFFSLSSNQNGTLFERTSTKMKKENPITKITLTLGLIEIVISTTILGGFIGPLENSSMWLV